MTAYVIQIGRFLFITITYTKPVNQKQAMDNEHGKDQANSQQKPNHHEDHNQYEVNTNRRQVQYKL